MATVLIIDDEAGVRRLLRLALEREGHAVLEAADGSRGVECVAADRPDVVLCDLVMPGLGGLEVLDALRAAGSAVPVVVVTGGGSTEQAIRAMARGACDYLLKPLDLPRALRTVRRILDSASPPPVAVAPAGGSGVSCPWTLIGKSDAIYEVSKLIGRVAGQPTTVLILGESGTGKELVARSIHAHGPRRAGPFVALNCAAIPESLLESELFGHERGAFTGADRLRLGKFELARGGTLFLDEVGDLAPATQAKLLRVLQEQEFTRLGGSETVRADARVVAATNRDLRADAAAGRFRDDLYYRLGVVSVRLPPLRDRREDIPLLVSHLLARSARELSLGVTAVHPDALARLCVQAWPGNVRELANALHQAVLECPGATLLPDQFPPATPPAATLFDAAALRAHVVRAIESGEQSVLQPLLDAYQAAVVAAALGHCGGNVSRAARHLGVHRVTLKTRAARV